MAEINQLTQKGVMETCSKIDKNIDFMTNTMKESNKDIFIYVKDNGGGIPKNISIIFLCHTLRQKVKRGVV